MAYRYGKTSKSRMKGVHPKLIECAELALSYGVMDLTVLPDGGLRTPERQMELVEKGASKTLHSKHLPQDDGYSHAIDLAPYPVDWSDIDRFVMYGTLMFRAAAEVGLILRWGGHWNSFKDYPHFEIKEIL